MFPTRAGANLVRNATVILLGLLGAGSVNATGIVAWGCNTAGQTNVPKDLEDAVEVAAGENHCLALRASGTVVAWGDNSAGQCDVPFWLSDVVSVSAGDRFSVALCADGTAVAWGLGELAQTEVPLDETNLVAISAGQTHALALRQDGTFIGWGNDFFGQASGPEDLSSIVAVHAGYGYSLAITAEGSLVGWGDNLPAQLPGTIGPLRAVAGGRDYCLGLRQDGSVVAWGNNALATQVPAWVTGVRALSSGSTLAVKQDGTLVAWGDNAWGQTTIPTGISNVLAVAGSSTFNLALLQKTAALSLEIRNPRWSQGVFMVSVRSLAGTTYSLEYKSDPSTEDWHPLPAVPGTGGLLTLTDETAADGKRIYRVKMAQP